LFCLRFFFFSLFGGTPASLMVLWVRNSELGQAALAWGLSRSCILVFIRGTATGGSLPQLKVAAAYWLTASLGQGPEHLSTGRCTLSVEADRSRMIFLN
jgi:hypothetical protein